MRAGRSAWALERGIGGGGEGRGDDAETAAVAAVAAALSMRPLMGEEEGKHGGGDEDVHFPQRTKGRHKVKEREESRRNGACTRASREISIAFHDVIFAPSTFSRRGAGAREFGLVGRFARVNQANGSCLLGMRPLSGSRALCVAIRAKN